MSTTYDLVRLGSGKAMVRRTRKLLWWTTIDFMSGRYWWNSSSSDEVAQYCLHAPDRAAEIYQMVMVMAGRQP